MKELIKKSFLTTSLAIFSLLSFQVNSAPLYTFSVPGLGHINIDNYQTTRSGNESGALLKGGFSLREDFKCPDGQCLTSFRWIQMIATNAAADNWTGTPPKLKDSGIDLNSQLWGKNISEYMKEEYYLFLDPWSGSYHDSAPFYTNNEGILSGRNGYTYAFEDSPWRKGDGVYYNNTKMPLDWGAELALVATYDNKLSYLGSIKWGWERLNSNKYLEPGSLSFSPVSGALKQLVKADYAQYEIVDAAYCKVTEPPILALLLLSLAGLGFYHQARQPWDV